MHVEGSLEVGGNSTRRLAAPLDGGLQYVDREGSRRGRDEEEAEIRVQERQAWQRAIAAVVFESETGRGCDAEV